MIFLLPNALRELRRSYRMSFQTWLSEDEYAQIEAEWQEQFELREELKNKPSAIKGH